MQVFEVDVKCLDGKRRQFLVWGGRTIDSLKQEIQARVSDADLGCPGADLPPNGQILTCCGRGLEDKTTFSENGIVASNETRKMLMADGEINTCSFKIDLRRRFLGGGGAGSAGEQNQAPKVAFPRMIALIAAACMPGKYTGIEFTMVWGSRLGKKRAHGRCQRRHDDVRLTEQPHSLPFRSTGASGRHQAEP